MDEKFEAIICLRYFINCKDIEKMIYDWSIFLHFLDLYQGQFKRDEECYRCGNVIKFNTSKYYHYTFNCIYKVDRWNLMFGRTYDFISGKDLTDTKYWKLKEAMREEDMNKIEKQRINYKYDFKFYRNDPEFNSDSIVVTLGNY